MMIFQQMDFNYLHLIVIILIILKKIKFVKIFYYIHIKLQIFEIYFHNIMKI